MTNHINDLAEACIVIRPSGKAVPFDDGSVAAGWISGLTAGIFVGKNSSGKMVHADARSSVRIPALGALALNASQSYAVGSKTGSEDQKSVDAYADYLTFKNTGFSLTPGQPIWLSSGGGITQTMPTEVGNLRQQVGFAVSATEYAVRIGPAEINGI